MKKYKDHTVANYVEVLSARTPVPGGGSAAAMVAAVGTGLISMVIRYSIGKTDNKRIEAKMRSILKENERIKRRLTALIDLDAKAYLNVTKMRGKSLAQRKKTLRKAAEIPREVARLCYKAMQPADYLVKHGNRFLVSDVEVAAELLLASFHAAQINVKVNL